ncbi:WXG100 family type VII secretion target [Arthrobacter sp. GMC3]|uniref:WXG100 family type VII secretion target n=1 Tax=Arthrobacter sp. GMC3 TaxID=2058894 RepID=UPI000CE444E0|nr:hypothetical protein [Arthrobacter sp. GMC3]
MAGMIGNDPQDMGELATKLNQAVEQIHQLTAMLDSKAQSVRWEGPDATRFKSTQWPQHKTALTRVSQELESVKNLVNKQKQEQLNASS